MKIVFFYGEFVPQRTAICFVIMVAILLQHLVNEEFQLRGAKN